jgi:hypothetical protein
MTPLVSNEKNPLEGKVAIHKSIKDLATFPKAAKISFQTKEVHISNDGNQVVELGIQLLTPQTQNDEWKLHESI